MNPLWSNIFRKKLEEESLAFFLGNVPVFAELGKRERVMLESLVHIRNYKPLETVFEEGDPGSGMYIIRSGRVQVFSRRGNGKEIEIARLAQSEFFGETTLTAPATRTASVRALETTELLGIFRADMLELAKKHPAVAYNILVGVNRIVSERLQYADDVLMRLRIDHPGLFAEDSE